MTAEIFLQIRATSSERTIQSPSRSFLRDDTGVFSQRKKGINPSNTKLIFFRPIYVGHLNESQLQTGTGACPYDDL